MSENLEKYRAAIEEIQQQTKDELWTMPFATLILLLCGILFITVVVNIVFYSFESWLLAVPIYALEIGALFYALYRYRQKTHEIMRVKTSKMDATDPGISEAYEKWRKG